MVVIGQEKYYNLNVLQGYFGYSAGLQEIRKEAYPCQHREIK